MKKLVHILILLQLCLFIACGTMEDGADQVPASLLSPTEMRDVLMDFALAESASNMNVRSVKNDKVDSAYNFNPLKTHGIRKSQYDSSIHYYSAHPKLYRAVYDSVLTKLNEYRLSREKIKKDSLAE